MREWGTTCKVEKDGVLRRKLLRMTKKMKLLRMTKKRGAPEDADGGSGNEWGGMTRHARIQLYARHPVRSCSSFCSTLVIQLHARHPFDKLRAGSERSEGSVLNEWDSSSYLLRMTRWEWGATRKVKKGGVLRPSGSE